MIERLDIKGFRGFERLTVERLARVNLLVGKNNAGKTSVLEAVRLLAATNAVREMGEIAVERGEVMPDTPEDLERRARPFAAVDLSHFFHGHEVREWSEFKLSAGDGEADVHVRAVIRARAELDDSIEIIGSSRRDAAAGQLSEAFETFALVLASERPHAYPGRQRAFPLREDGSFPVERRPWSRPRPVLARNDGIAAPRCVVISPDSLDGRTMSSMWADRVRFGRESDVIDALKVLDPAIRDIHFLQSDRYATAASEGILVGRNGQMGRIPLGSMGDGVRRMLALSLALASARGGYFLVDEIDTGLHHSVLAGMWKLVMAAAEQNDVQVFATTHSKDCLEGLAEAVEKDAPGLLDDARSRPAVFQITAGHPEALRFDASDLRYALETELEIRGR